MSVHLKPGSKGCYFPEDPYSGAAGAACAAAAVQDSPEQPLVFGSEKERTFYDEAQTRERLKEDGYYLRLQEQQQKAQAEREQDIIIKRAAKEGKRCLGRRLLILEEAFFPSLLEHSKNESELSCLFDSFPSKQLSFEERIELYTQLIAASENVLGSADVKDLKTLKEFFRTTDDKHLKDSDTGLSREEIERYRKYHREIEGWLADESALIDKTKRGIQLCKDLKSFYEKGIECDASSSLLCKSWGDFYQAKVTAEGTQKCLQDHLSITKRLIEELRLFPCAEGHPFVDEVQELCTRLSERLKFYDLSFGERSTTLQVLFRKDPSKYLELSYMHGLRCLRNGDCYSTINQCLETLLCKPEEVSFDNLCSFSTLFYAGIGESKKGLDAGTLSEPIQGKGRAFRSVLDNWCNCYPEDSPNLDEILQRKLEPKVEEIPQEKPAEGSSPKEVSKSDQLLSMKAYSYFVDGDTSPEAKKCYKAAMIVDPEDFSHLEGYIDCCNATYRWKEAQDQASEFKKAGLITEE